MMRAAVFLIALCGCASAPSPAAPRASDAWLVVAVYDDGTQVARRDFATREEAEAFVRASGPEPGDNAPTLAVQRDSVDLRVRIDGVDITAPRHISMRENWLKRNRWTESLRPVGARAVVFTWRPGESADPHAARFGGKAPLPAKSAWPLCATCGRSMAYIGTLDFRSMASLPGAALTLHHCSEGHGFAASWLGADAVLKAPPSGAAEGWIGTGWAVTDFPWEWNSERAYEDRFDKLLAGPAPQFLVNVRGAKVGGHVFWIQDDRTPQCSCGKPMRFIGQFVNFGGVSFGESGSACVFYCGACRDTRVARQSF